MICPHQIDTFHFYDDPTFTYWILYTELLSRTAALSVLIYERCIILEQEVDLIWLKRKTWVTFLYFFISWVTIAWLVVRMIPVDPSLVSAIKVVCTVYILGSDLVALLMTLSVQVVLQFRVWAIYERSRKIMWFLTVLITMEIMTMVTFMAITIATLDKLPIVSTPFGCAFETLPPLTSLFWVSAIIVEPILCILVLRKAFGLLNARTETTALLARDSLVYFLPIFAELSSMLVAWLTHPLYINFFFPWTIAFPSLFGCRLLLNIRQHFESPRTSDEVEMATYSSV